MGFGNARKSYGGRLMALRDDYIMKKKRDFEKELREKVKLNSDLNTKYGSIWDGLESSIAGLRKIANELFVFNLGNGRVRFVYYENAKKVIELAENLKLSEDERELKYKSENLENTINSIFPEDSDKELNDKMVRALVEIIIDVLGEDHKLVKKLC